MRKIERDAEEGRGGRPRMKNKPAPNSEEPKNEIERAT